MNIGTAAIGAAVLSLLYLTLHDHNRAWKSFDWDALTDFMNTASSLTPSTKQDP
ncbi:hypothetical protein PHO31112_03279 [Pandoraea horticolens]|uniref:DUF6429 domain-containing protein n=1 Tax=Pandoraea horticolens TaxID=2508298 RepID=A0A5E4WLR3_9BURK|nr:hypothetical protein PHO31112_03279 [Pandoraea horticolens]